MSFDPYKLSATEIASKVHSGEWEARDIAESSIRRIENLHRELNTHINWDQDDILRSVEQQLDYIAAACKAGKALPMAGVPVALKDNIAVKGSFTTCGSRILGSFRSPYDATVVQKLKAAGALLLGKTNLDEFGMGSSNENSAYGAALNPWNTKRVPGGSSGGSAAAVAAGMVPIALGSDTGGSIRQPASFCGVVGFKPSYGRVSRYGLVAYASSLDQIGPFSRTVEDAALVYDTIAGPDPRDATMNRQAAPSCLEALKSIAVKDLKGIKIGLVEEFWAESGLDEEVKLRVDAAIEDLKGLGAEIVRVSLPSVAYAMAAYYIIAAAEASSNLSRFDGIRYGYRSQSSGPSLQDLYTSSRSEALGKEVKQRIMLGTFALSSGHYDAYYEKASKVRRLIQSEIAEAFQRVDLLVGPTAPTVAFDLGSKTSDPLAMYLSDIYTTPVNLGGLPALSMPCGFNSESLPVGLQIIAPQYQEDRLLKCAFLYEKNKRWNDEFKPRC